MSCTLGIDTATADAAVAVTLDGDVIHETSIGPRPDGMPQHSTSLLPAIGEAAEAAGGWEQLDRIGVGVGPGSFTGLRIGIATARALAQARRLPLAAVVTLAALGRGMEEESRGGDQPLLPTLDARRGQAFTALYDAGGDELWPPAVLSPDELVVRVKELHDPPLAAGEGALRFRRQLEQAGAAVPADDSTVHRVAARHVCRLAETAAPTGPGDIRPLYLREPDAKVWLERDRADRDTQQ